jgi:fatty-acyl-CoA synthase
MRKDAGGYFYLVDRIGDTFRWKGENVSTTEVSEAISAFSGILDVAVYGVAIPGSAGRAGMAAIVVTPNFELDAFHRHLVDRLPDYARPLFLRICDTIETTGTLRPKKQGLVGEGYDISDITDPIYFNDRTRATFVKVDRALYQRLRIGYMHL